MRVHPKKAVKKKIRATKKSGKFHSPEIIGVLLLFIGLLFLLSLISYSGQDPSWAHTGDSVQKVHNIAGRAGASLSEALLQGFGLASFVFCLSLFFLGYHLIRPSVESRIFSRITASFILLLLLTALFTVVFGTFRWGGVQIAAGGLLGDICTTLLFRAFNHLGTILILLVLLFLFILFTTHLSVHHILRALASFLRFSFKGVHIRIAQYQKTKSREQMKRRVMEKHLSPPGEAGGVTIKSKKWRTRPELSKEKKERKRHPMKAPAPKTVAQEKLPFPPPQKTGYQFPPYNLLDKSRPAEKIDKDELLEKKELIEEKLAQFGVTGEVKQYHPGPVITTYEFFPDAGIKVSKVANLSEEVSLALSAISVRIRRIPGKSSLGIEVPNNHRETICIRDVIESPEFLESESKLTYALGKTVHGEIYITDLANMPHLLIAGATGTGKSVALNCLIASLLYKASPDEVKLILIDPKRIELSAYEGIPHLMCPVVKDPRKAEAVLFDAIKKMEARYRVLGRFNVRDIGQYNALIHSILNDKRRKLSEEELEDFKPMPYIVIIIDELAELMMLGAKEVNYCITRLAQLARAVGIHLVMATQRPSVDIITGTIKNNFASRIAFRVPTKIDSRVILDTIGADKLLGDGDMLFIPPKSPRITRLHGSFIKPLEINRILKFVKDQGEPEFDKSLVDVLEKPAAEFEEEGFGEKDPMFDKAVELVLATEQASASFLQRRLRFGYARASRILDQMEQDGIVGPSEGGKKREILVDPQAYLRRVDHDTEN
ncbi:MAG: DNA translocase FtsK [Acidobacteria bacterium]|nr:DNA translocase FtsK [Acidobacteriota bacterium]